MELNFKILEHFKYSTIIESLLNTSSSFTTLLSDEFEYHMVTTYC